MTREPEAEERLELARGLEASARKLAALDLEAVSEDRRGFLQGLRALGEGRLEEAVGLLRVAKRKNGAPWADLAAFALAQAQRLSGKEGAALRELVRLGRDEGVAADQRAMAWMSVAAVEEARGNERGLRQAREALEALGVAGV